MGDNLVNLYTNYTVLSAIRNTYYYNSFFWTVKDQWDVLNRTNNNFLFTSNYYFSMTDKLICNKIDMTHFIHIALLSET